MTDGAVESSVCGRGDSALGDSVLSTDDMSDPTYKHRGYSGDDDDDDVIPGCVGEFQVADVTSYFQSLRAEYQRSLGNAASSNVSSAVLSVVVTFSLLDVFYHNEASICGTVRIMLQNVCLTS